MRRAALLGGRAEKVGKLLPRARVREILVGKQKKSSARTLATPLASAQCRPAGLSDLIVRSASHRSLATSGSLAFLFVPHLSVLAFKATRIYALSKPFSEESRLAARATSHSLASAFKTSTKARVIFVSEKKHQRKHVRTKLTQTAQSLSYAMSQVPNSTSYTYLLMTCKRFRARLAQAFEFVSLGT